MPGAPTIPDRRRQDRRDDSPATLAVRTRRRLCPVPDPRPRPRRREERGEPCRTRRERASSGFARCSTAAWTPSPSGRAQCRRCRSRRGCRGFRIRRAHHGRCSCSVLDGSYQFPSALPARVRPRRLREPLRRRILRSSPGAHGAVRPRPAERAPVESYRERHGSVFVDSADSPDPPTTSLQRARGRGRSAGVDHRGHQGCWGHRGRRVHSRRNSSHHARAVFRIPGS